MIKRLLLILLSFLPIYVSAQEITADEHTRVETVYGLQREMTGASPSAYKFEKVISSIWLSFIKTGNPNVKGLPKWEPFTEQNGVTMILDNKCYPLNHHDSELLKLSRPIW